MELHVMLFALCSSLELSCSDPSVHSEGYQRLSCQSYQFDQLFTQKTDDGTLTTCALILCLACNCTEIWQETIIQEPVYSEDQNHVPKFYRLTSLSNLAKLTSLSSWIAEYASTHASDIGFTPLYL